MKTEAMPVELARTSGETTLPMEETQKDTVPSVNMESIAHHEAAHFVVGFRLGSNSAWSLSIIPDDDSAGRVDGESWTAGWTGTAGDLPVQAMRHEIVGLFCGAAAEEKLGVRCKDEIEVRASDDEYQADRTLVTLEDDEEQRERLRHELKAEAARRVEENWSAIEAVADELLKHEKMDCFEAEIIIGIVDGVDEQSDLDQYRALIGRGAAEGK